MEGKNLESGSIKLKTLDFDPLCVTFAYSIQFGAIGTSFHLSTRKDENLTSLMKILHTVAKSGGWGGAHLPTFHAEGLLNGNVTSFLPMFLSMLSSPTPSTTRMTIVSDFHVAGSKSVNKLLHAAMESMHGSQHRGHFHTPISYVKSDCKYEFKICKRKFV